ncbi:hypothetical protein Taro_047932 [Colocasia esculenta]|uniref:Uncharacterized protein n=1 Tax=Colocasia esculenta TaxID=4460 RepID=A0A843WX81_COLES|nr:hypothetical protein [Colocasia esculenta]
MRGRFSSITYMKSFFDYSVVFCSSRLPALRRRTSRSPMQNLILSRRRAQDSVQLSVDQLQRLAKIPICSGKSVEFSHLNGSLSWVEETLTAMGWTKLCQISELSVASAARSFYASLKVSSGNTVVGYVKGINITISEEYLVELLDCPNSGHCLSEFIPLEKQKLGIIGSLGTLCKRGLQVNELSAEKRLIHSIITNIITPRADVPVSTKEKIGLITLRRSHYSLVGKKQNLWFKDSVPECEHEIYPDEPKVSLLIQDLPGSSVQIEAPSIRVNPEAPVQLPEPIEEQVAHQDIPPAVQIEEVQIPASSYSPSQFETRPSLADEQEEEAATAQDPQHQDQTQEKFLEDQVLEQTIEKDQEIQADQQPSSDEHQQQQQQVEQTIEQQAQLAIVVSDPSDVQQQVQESENQPEEVATTVEDPMQKSAAKRPLEPSQYCQTFKINVKRRLVKDGVPVKPVLPSPSSRAISPTATPPPEPTSSTPSVILSSVVDSAATSSETTLAPPAPQPAPAIPTPAAPISEPQSSALSSSTPLSPHSSLDLLPVITPVDPFNEDVKFSIYPLKYQSISGPPRPSILNSEVSIMKDSNWDCMMSLRGRAVSYRREFTETIFNKFFRISARFKIKYKSKLSFQRFIFIQLSKKSKHLLDIQLSFAESERFTPEQWEVAYPSYHSQCRKMKLNINQFHSKFLLDFHKSVTHRWAERYLIYYQAKDAAISHGLYWNLTFIEFLQVASTKKFVPLKFKLDIDKFHHNIGWYRRRHIKSIKKLPSTNPTYNVDDALFEHSFNRNEEKLWELIQPFLKLIPASLLLPRSRV